MLVDVLFYYGIYYVQLKSFNIKLPEGSMLSDISLCQYA